MSVLGESTGFFDELVKRYASPLHAQFAPARDAVNIGIHGGFGEFHKIVPTQGDWLVDRAVDGQKPIPGINVRRGAICQNRPIFDL